MTDLKHQQNQKKPNELLRRARISRGWTQAVLAEMLDTDMRNVGRWENDGVLPNDLYLQKLCENFGMTEIELGFVSPEEYVPPYCYIPYRRNPCFTGRESILQTLYDALEADRKRGLPLAISGVGGMGKTQLVVEYVYKYGYRYQAIFCARAKNHSMLVADIVTIAGVLDLPQKQKQDFRVVVAAVQQWLNTHSHWLLVFDNVTDLDMLSAFLPRPEKGHIALTTLSQLVGTYAHKINLEKMDQEESLALLLRSAKLIEHGTLLEQSSLYDGESASEIVRELDGLPLALDQARAYIEGGRCSVAEYLQLYRMRRKALLQKRGSPHSGHPESVVTTFSLSFERVQQDNPIAATLLGFCAHLHPDIIPQELITANIYRGDSTSHQLIPDPTLGRDAIDDLLRYSLVRQLADDRTLTIHRLVQAVMQDAMEEDEQKQWAMLAVGAIYQALLDSGQDTMQEYGRYILHAELCAEFIRRWEFHFPEALHLLIELSRYLRRRASYDQAERYGLQAADLLEEISSPEPVDRVQAFANLAHIYQAKGLHESAESYYKQAVVILENELPGYDDALLAICQSNLAQNHMQRGRLKAAEPLAQRAMALIERVRGPEHAEFAYCLTVLATIYREQERYVDAEPLYERALAIYERALGPEALDVANSLNNLATIYVVLEKHDDAELLNRRALAIFQKVQGPEHPDVARCLLCLSDFYTHKQDWLGVKQLNQQALAIYEKALGDEYPNSFEPLFNLAGLAHRDGRYKEAQSWYRRALDIVEKYPHIADAWLAALGYADVLERLHKPAQATQMRALAGKLRSQSR